MAEIFTALIHLFCGLVRGLIVGGIFCLIVRFVFWVWEEVDYWMRWWRKKQ